MTSFAPNAAACAIALAQMVVQDGHAAQGERIIEPDGLVTRLEQDQLQVVSPDGAADWGWRIYLRASAAAPTTRVTISELGSGEEVTVTRLSSFGTSWTDPLPARALVLTTDQPGDLEVQAIGLRVLYNEPETPVGRNNAHPVRRSDRSAELEKLAKGVGRLSLAGKPPSDAVGIQTSRNTIFCTVFVVRRRFVMTAAHCVEGSLEARVAEIWLEYLDGTTVPRSRRFAARVVHVSRRLDAALLKLDRRVSANRVLTLASEPVGEQGGRLLVLQHFGGSHLAVSDDADCEIREYGTPGPPVWGTDGDATLMDAAFEHGCDTSKSSSGAPVFDSSGARVLGMHRKGYLDDEPEVNHAIRSDHLHRWIADTLTDAR